MDEKEESSRHISGLYSTIATSPNVRTPSPELTQSSLSVPTKLFHATLKALQVRSGGKCESAAIWAGIVHGNMWNAEQVFYHHELCNDRATALSLELTEKAKFFLYTHLAEQNLRLVALLHTHPGKWVGLSQIDAKNQISSRLGFWSIVVPRYGRKPWSLRSMGFHIRIENGWRRLRAKEIAERVNIRD